MLFTILLTTPPLLHPANPVIHLAPASFTKKAAANAPRPSRAYQPHRKLSTVGPDTSSLFIHNGAGYLPVRPLGELVSDPIVDNRRG